MQHGGEPGLAHAATSERSESSRSPGASVRDEWSGDALQFVNSPVGRALNLRGVNAKVVSAGTVKVGDRIRKL